MEGREHNRPGVSRVYLVGVGRNWWLSATAEDRAAYIGGDLHPITEDLEKCGWSDENDYDRGVLANKHTEEVTLPDGTKAEVWCHAVARERLKNGMFLDFIPLLHIPGVVKDGVPYWYEYMDMQTESEEAKRALRYGGGATAEEAERFYGMFLATAERLRQEAEEVFANHCELSLPLPEMV